MNIEYHQKNPYITTANFRPLPNLEDDQTTIPQIETENQSNSLQAAVSNREQNNTLTISKSAPLNETQKKTLIHILQQPYIIPGKNGTAPLKLNLHFFLKELQSRLQLNLHPGESVSIKLIGSAAGHIITPQQTRYNDLDFLIQIQMPIMPNHLSSPTYIDGLIKGGVAAHFLKTTRDIEACLATQLKFPNANEDVLASIGNTFFSGKPTYINTPINWSDLTNPADNRCSIIKFGMLEFKTTIDFIIDDEQKPIVLIPGLKNSCAFQRDSFRICLTNKFLDRKKNWMEAPLEFHTSDVPIEQALAELNTKELRTSRIDGSKCLKGNDNITFKGCFYPEEKTNRAIYIDFLKDARSPKKMINHFGKYKDVMDFICALSNFYTNGTNLEVDSKLIQPFYDILPEVLSGCKEISEKLLLRWYQLLLFLSADHENSTPHFCKLNLDDHVYHLIKPKQPITLLQGFMQLWNKQSKISFEKLPKLELKIESTVQLFEMLECHIEKEQLIPFNLCLLSYIPTALDNENNLEFEMLTRLLTSLPNLDSTESRKKLIKQTELLLKKRNIKAPELFENLKKYAQTNELQISHMFLISIQALFSTSRTMALSLWSYAEREELFSAADELEAFVCFEKVIPTTSLNKKQVISLLERMMFRLSYVSKKLTSEYNEQPTSFNKLLMSLANQLSSQEDLNLKDFDFIENFFKDISPLSESLKEKIENKFLDSFIRLSLERKVKETEQGIILNILNEMLKSSSKKIVESHMNKVLCYLRAFPNNPFHSGSFLSAFEILKTYLDKDTSQKEEALEIYTSLMQNCLNSKSSELIHIAEKVLQRGIKSTCLSVRTCLANLISNLITLHAKTDHAQILLKEAVGNNIFNLENPLSLVKAYGTVLEGLIDSNPDKISKFVESCLQNPQLINALPNIERKDANKLILLLINNSHQVESVDAIKNLITLFQLLCKNTQINSSNEKKNLELGMLNLLIKLLPDLASVQIRQTFVKQAQLFFEKSKLNVTQLFNQLNSFSSLNLSTSSLFLKCINDLSLTSPELALSLWQYAEKEQIFEDSVGNQLEAFTCIQKMQMNDHLDKIQIIAQIKDVMNRITSLSKKLTSTEITQPDNFNAYFINLVSKLSLCSLNNDGLKFIQNLLKEIATLPFMTASFKAEITEDFLDCFIRLASKKLPKNEQTTLLNILKEIFKAHPKETVKKIVQCLRAFPYGASLSNEFLKNPIFTSTLIKEIKEGSFENRSEWFAILIKGKLLQPDDKESLECCMALVNTWASHSNVQLCPQVLSALQLLSVCIEMKKRKQISIDLKNQALKSYINFVQGCIATKKSALLQEAEKALRTGTKFISSPDRAKLFSDLICAHPKKDPPMTLLKETLKQDILNEKTPVEFIKAYQAVFTGLTSTAPTTISNFAIFSLQNPTLINLLQNPETENVNELILMLIHIFRNDQILGLTIGGHQAPSSTDITILIRLIKQLYKNRKATQNADIDETIVWQTTSAFRIFDQIDYVSFKQWVALTNALTIENSMFQDKEKRELFNIALMRVATLISQFIDKTPAIGNNISTYEKLLKICKQFQQLPCFSVAAKTLQFDHLQILILLNRPQELLQTLKNIKEDWQRFRGIEQTIMILLDYESQKFTNDTIKILDQVLEMLEEFREPNKLAKSLKFVDLKCLHNIPDQVQEDETTNFADKVFDIVEELLRSHPEKFEHLEATCTLVIDTACNNYCLLHASSILDYAVRKKIFVNQECISQLKSKIQAKAMEVIQLHINGLKKNINFGDFKAKSDCLEEILLNHKLVDLLILHLHEEPTNELIFLLVNHSHELTSEIAIKKLVKLIKRLLQPENINGISCELLGAVSYTLNTHTIISKNHAHEVREFIPIIIKRHMPLINTFILTHHKDNSMKDACLKALSFLKNLEPYPLDPQNELFFQQSYRQNLILLDCTDELLLKLQNILDPSLCFRAIQDSLYFILKFKPVLILNPTNEIISIIEMLEKHCNGSLENVIAMEPFVNFVLMLLHASTDAKEPIVDHFLRILNECLKSHQEKFVDLKSTYTALLKTAILKGYFLSASTILNTAIQQEIKLNPSILLDIKTAVDAMMLGVMNLKI